VNRCLVCEAPVGAPVFDSMSERAITSLGRLRPGRTRVWWCGDCGHLQTEPLADIAEYYDRDYELLTSSEDEDQVHAIVDGRVVYRTEFQAELILERHGGLSAGAKVLDAGAGKGGTLRHVLTRRPDLDGHLFDVSDRYRPFWERLVDADRCATHELPAEWSGRFDLVTSLFVLEHVPDPVTILGTYRALLTPGGRLHLLVPDVGANPADFIVCDHVNHFSAASLRCALERSGFEIAALDADAHRGALLAIAAPGAAREHRPDPATLAALTARTEAMRAGFASLATDVRSFERDHPGPAAVYGAGFYGTMLDATLERPARCFVDRNPHLQGTTHLDRPVVAPDALPQDVTTVYVGLNPAIAREAIAEIAGWRQRPLDLFFLPDLDPAATPVG
jgi:SAM-dependent methyltransferase